MKYFKKVFLVSLMSLLVVPVSALAAVQSLNGLTVQNQTFTNDSNITINSSGTVHSLGWNGLLPVARGGTGVNIANLPAHSVLFKNAGVVSGDANFVWDKNNDLLKLGNTNNIFAVLDTSLLASSDKTFTFPDESGTLCTTTSGCGGGGTPGGFGSPNKSIQWNDDAGNFGGDNVLFYVPGATALYTGYSIRLQDYSSTPGSPLEIRASNDVFQLPPDSDGHTLTIHSGDGNGTGKGGDLSLVTGEPGSSGDGGNIFLQASHAGEAGNNNGGNIYLESGQQSGGGLQGIIKLKTGGSFVYANLDTLSLVDTDKDFSFPNASGTFSLLESNQDFSGENTFSNPVNKFISVTNSTVHIGTDGIPGCIVMGDSDGSGVTYVTVNDGVLSVSSTQPSNCN